MQFVRCKSTTFLEDITRYYACGVTEKQLYTFYGVGKTQWTRYKKENPELTDALSKAKVQFSVGLVNKAYQIAIGYDYEETKVVEYFDANGVVTGKKVTTAHLHAKADAGMLKFLLINRFPDEWANDPQILELRQKALEMAKASNLPIDAEGL